MEFRAHKFGLFGDEARDYLVVSDEEYATRLHWVRGLCHYAKKFTVDRHDLIEDDERKGLVGATIRLPFDAVAIEIAGGYQPDLPARDGCGPTKVIVFAQEDERDGLGDGGDAIDSLTFEPVILVMACLFRETKGGVLEILITAHDKVCTGQDGTAWKVGTEWSGSGDEHIRGAYSLFLVSDFLNMLACSNVHIEQHAPRKPNKNAKNALPFDTYHTLTVDIPKKSGASDPRGGSHAAPREHLRRGHIRRLDDNRRIWVNSCVVSAGRGFGKVEKDYRVRSAEHRC